MVQSQSKRKIDSNLVRLSRELYHQYLQADELYASNRILAATQDESKAGEKEKGASDRLVINQGYDACARSLQQILHCRADSSRKILIPSIEKLPRYTAWVPVKSDIWLLDGEDIICRFPHRAIQQAEFCADKFKVAMEEYEEHRIKNKAFKFPPIEIITNSRSPNEDSLHEQRIFAARCKVITDKLGNVSPKSRSRIIPSLQRALELKAREDMSKLVSHALKELKIQEKIIETRKIRQKTKLMLSNGVPDETSLRKSTAFKLVEQTQKFFCFTCFVFNCELHADVSFNVSPVKPIADDYVTFREKQLNTGPYPCSIRCYMLLNSNNSGSVKESERLKWTSEELDTLKVAVPTFRFDPCSLAKVLGTRTCREVFMKLLEPRLQKWAFAVIEASKKSRNIGFKDPTKDKRVKEGQEEDFIPCNHAGPCDEGSCPCVFLGLSCESTCGCNNIRYSEGPSGREIVEYGEKCENSHYGCDCKPGTCGDDCICWKSMKACKPGSCKCLSTLSMCSSLITKKCHCMGKCQFIPCRNLPFSLQKRKRTAIGNSPVHGYGLFAATHIPKGEFIGIYTGQLMNTYVCELLGFGYDAHDHTFLFDLTETVANDATILGSVVKFINHASTFEEGKNCVSRKQYNRGMPSIAYFAACDVNPGDELFIDYQIQENKPCWMPK